MTTPLKFRDSFNVHTTRWLCSAPFISIKFTTDQNALQCPPKTAGNFSFAAEAETIQPFLKALTCPCTLFTKVWRDFHRESECFHITSLTGLKGKKYIRKYNPEHVYLESHSMLEKKMLSPRGEGRSSIQDILKKKTSHKNSAHLIIFIFKERTKKISSISHWE